MVALNALLAAYGPAERRAILVHKYFLGLDCNRAPSPEETIASWERHHAWEWRASKMRRDAQAQLREIDAHRRELMRVTGHPVDFNEAAQHWVEHMGPSGASPGRPTTLLGAERPVSPTAVAAPAILPGGGLPS